MGPTATRSSVCAASCAAGDWSRTIGVLCVSAEWLLSTMSEAGAAASRMGSDLAAPDSSAASTNTTRIMRRPARKSAANSRISVAERRTIMDWSQSLPESRRSQRTISFGRGLAGIVARADKYCVGHDRCMAEMWSRSRASVHALWTIWIHIRVLYRSAAELDGRPRISAHFVTVLTRKSGRFLADSAAADHFLAKSDLRLACRIL